MSIAVAIIHGMGMQKEDFSKPLQQGIAKYYDSLGENYNWHDLLFSEIFWSDILNPQQHTLFERLNRKRLDYQSLRQFFVTYLGDVIAYQAIEDKNTSDANPFREEIHQRIKDGIASYTQVKGFDDNTPLVLIGHSLGTVMMFNYIWHHQHQTSGHPFTLGHTLCGFITLGSPLALWTLRYPGFGKPFDFPGKALNANLKERAKWLNIYDRDDVFAYPLKPINQAFDETVSEDIECNVGHALASWNPLSHGDYYEDKDVHLYIAQFLASISHGM